MRYDPFSIAVHRSCAGTVVAVRGELDVANARELAKALDGAGPNVTIDLNGATFADAALVSVLWPARAEGRRLRVRCQRGGAVARLLTLSGAGALLST